jgi:hypothetical protein
MAMTFRDLLEDLRAAGKLVDQSKQALLLRAVAGYEMPVLCQGRPEADPGGSPSGAAGQG